MLKVLICSTEGAEADEVSAVECGVRQALGYVREEVRIDKSSPACDPDLWQQHCLDKSTTAREYPQITAECLRSEVLDSLMTYAADNGQTLEDWRPVTVIVLDADLASECNNFLFGATDTMPAAVSMLSVWRFRTIESIERRRKVLQRLARHEFGHALGLVPEDRQANVEKKIGLHCTNLCTMRQGMCPEEFEDLTIEEEENGIVFCSECTDYLSKRQNRP